MGTKKTMDDIKEGILSEVKLSGHKGYSLPRAAEIGVESRASARHAILHLWSVGLVVATNSCQSSPNGYTTRAWKAVEYATPEERRASTRRFLSGARAQVFYHLQSTGLQGATDHEGAKSLSMSINGYKSHRKLLQKAKLIERYGVRCRSVVWIASVKETPREL